MVTPFRANIHIRHFGCFGLRPLPNVAFVPINQAVINFRQFLAPLAAVFWCVRRPAVQLRNSGRFVILASGGFEGFDEINDLFPALRCIRGGQRFGRGFQTQKKKKISGTIWDAVKFLMTLVHHRIYLLAVPCESSFFIVPFLTLRRETHVAGLLVLVSGSTGSFGRLARNLHRLVSECPESAPRMIGILLLLLLLQNDEPAAWRCVFVDLSSLDRKLLNL